MSRAAAYAANAPLMGVPGAYAPPGGAGEWFRGAGGLRLRAAFWTPSALVTRKPRGTVIVSPGRTEPIEKYFEVIGNFLARGWCVVAHDWRGERPAGEGQILAVGDGRLRDQALVALKRAAL